MSNHNGTWVGRYLAFKTREEAEEFCREQHELGNTSAYVSSLNSHMQTSANTPIVVNAKPVNP
jgi:viroplasmin and RNaseH domain-containing protein